MLDSFAPFGFWNVFHLHAELNVLRDCKPGKKPELLKNQDAICLPAVDRLVIHQDLTCGLRLQPGNQVQQGRFAAA
jgi:hypothetical protein